MASFCFSFNFLIKLSMSTSSMFVQTKIASVDKKKRFVLTFYYNEINKIFNEIQCYSFKISNYLILFIFDLFIKCLRKQNFV